MDKHIFFSIVIPLYNKASFIETAIGSILEQTYINYELIIVNDGSTDDSLEKVIAFKDSRIVIIDQPNQGVATARNNGVSAAQSEYIAFLDGDDWWDTTFLASMAQLIEDFPAAGIYGCMYFWVKNGRKKVSINHEVPGFTGYFDYFRAYTTAWWMPLTSISVVVPKRVFQEMNGFKTQLKFGEDFDLWVRIALKYNVAYLNKPLAYYNQDVAAINRSLGDKLWKKEEHFIFNIGYLAEVERNNPKLKALLDGIRVRSLANFYLRNDCPEETKLVLSEVDFACQSTYFKRFYFWPKIVIKLYLLGKELGSNVKQKLIKFFPYNYGKL